jgi:hypothetical protein
MQKLNAHPMRSRDSQIADLRHWKPALQIRPLRIPGKARGSSFRPTSAQRRSSRRFYGVSREGEQRYSPAEVVDAIPTPVMGRPCRTRICTSHVERQNLSIRMGMRRMTRLTNAFSKKWDNLEAAYSLWFADYNFCRRHQTLRISPAMEAGISDHIWTIKELLAT